MVQPSFGFEVQRKCVAVVLEVLGFFGSICPYTFLHRTRSTSLVLVLGKSSCQECVRRWLNFSK